MISTRIGSIAFLLVAALGSCKKAESPAAKPTSAPAPAAGPVAVAAPAPAAAPEPAPAAPAPVAPAAAPFGGALGELAKAGAELAKQMQGLVPGAAPSAATPPRAASPQDAAAAVEKLKKLGAELVALGDAGQCDQLFARAHELLPLVDQATGGANIMDVMQHALAKAGEAMRAAGEAMKGGQPPPEAKPAMKEDMKRMESTAKLTSLKAAVPALSTAYRFAATVPEARQKTCKEMAKQIRKVVLE